LESEINVSVRANAILLHCDNTREARTSGLQRSVEVLRLAMKRRNYVIIANRRMRSAVRAEPGKRRKIGCRQCDR
jgi:hypothetical protein